MGVYTPRFVEEPFSTRLFLSSIDSSVDGCMSDGELANWLCEASTGLSNMVLVVERTLMHENGNDFALFVFGYAGYLMGQLADPEVATWKRDTIFNNNLASAELSTMSVLVIET